ncbi:putative protocadherin beta-18 [Octopus sinensis]|uniref:Protocadherin beta-18 n=1 Tax=Octopus sinensis TaxID=2607531 RepID=A0A6P7T2B9_9MOLL|nr:putative protocadherin beta-18 [Octopus sinensis]XP_036364464.1 putative protocadherin beta-18 [Octopus sinensis]XP_036364465.1 putative protocadherin beta-18 [Octopus sinensis]
MLVQVSIVMFLLETSFSADITYHIKEGQGPNTIVGDVADDIHVLENVILHKYNHITFSQLQKSGNLNLFNVTKTGKLYTAVILDAESLCKYNTECHSMVDVAVRNKKSFISIIEIKIIISDVNDNSPEFMQDSIKLQFSETDGKGTSKSIPNAFDRDVGFENSKISYQLLRSKDDPFILAVSQKVDGSAELEITSTQMLDREIKATYNLQIIAQDAGTPPRQNTLNVQITVEDENDNQPVFEQNVYNVSIMSSHDQSMLIITLTANDRDVGENGRISYYFASKTSESTKSNFNLNKRTGEISLNQDASLKRKQVYNLYVRAEDGGTPPKSSTAAVIINVINQKNSAPTIDVNFFSEPIEGEITIPEDISVGSFIAYIKVTDENKGEDGNVSCTIDNHLFQLHSLGNMKYKMVIQNPVDRERESKLNLTLICQDKGTPPLKTIKRFSVLVTDFNDVHPQFSKDLFKFLIYENENPNFPVGFIIVTDPDLGPGGQLTYSILNKSKEALPFEISNLGFISATESLDREKCSEYKFKVFVKDNGIPSLNNTADVIVEVVDKNDNPPYFTFPNVNPFSLDVHYHSQNKQDIIVLEASDRDIHMNAFLSYEIIGGNERNLFKINPYSGVLSFTRPIYQSDAGFYSLQFMAKDSGSPILSTVTNLSLTLTTSNKTTTVLTPVHSMSAKKIHINLMIVLLVAAVIFSITLVVSLTICIVRKNNSRNIHHNDGFYNDKYVDYVSREIHPPYDMPVTMETKYGKKTISQATLHKRQHHSGYIDKWKSPSVGLQLHDVSDELYQVTEISHGKDNKKGHLATATDHFSEMSTMSSFTDSGHGGSEADTGYYEELPCFRNDHNTRTSNHADSRNFFLSNPHQPTNYNNTVDLKSFKIGNSNSSSISSNPRQTTQIQKQPSTKSTGGNTFLSKPLPPIPNNYS